MRFIIMVVIVVAVAGLGAIAFRPRIARAAMLSVGATAPDFHSQVVNGDQVTPVSLADYHGHKLVLYFYPKDNTPGCTKEACAFRDGFALFQNAGLTVLGCSVDSSDAHRKFIQKYNLPFPLLLDPDKKIATSYGVANGIPILGLDKRVTYVIDEDGRILKVYPNVDPSIHATQILADLPAPKPVASAEASPASAPSAAAADAPGSK